MSMKINTHAKSAELFQRAAKVIPSGLYGHQGPAEGCCIPVSAYPLFSQKAEGSYFWDVDGNRYIDYMCAYGPNVLGYNDPDVNAAAMKQAELANCTTTPSYKMVEFARDRRYGGARRHLLPRAEHHRRHVCDDLQCAPLYRCRHCP